MSLIYVNRRILKRRHRLVEHSRWPILMALVYACGLAGCGDVSTAPALDPGPGPLSIATQSPLASGTVTDETVKVCAYNFSEGAFLQAKQAIIELRLRTI